MAFYKKIQTLPFSYKQYTILIFGLIAFFSTGLLGLISFYKHLDAAGENIAIYLPYGVLIFFFNIFYLKAIRLSREDYENKLKKEKEYSQRLLAAQKRFLRYAVHETNTPLAVIVANIELHEMEYGKHVALQNIEAATKNISGIYDDLSYLIQRDKLEYRKEKIDFVSFVKNRVHFFDVVAKQSNISFDIVDKTNSASLLFNETRLQRIVDNNITNAIKYTYEYESVTIRLLETSDTIIFEIYSHSTHIEDTDHIFDAYYREDNLEEGLGLGLDLVKSICSKENIDISVTSNETRTTFCYTFPKDNDENTAT